MGWHHWWKGGKQACPTCVSPKGQWWPCQLVFYQWELFCWHCTTSIPLHFSGSTLQKGEGHMHILVLTLPNDMILQGWPCQQAILIHNEGQRSIMKKWLSDLFNLPSMFFKQRIPWSVPIQVKHRKNLSRSLSTCCPQHSAIMYSCTSFMPTTMSWNPSFLSPPPYWHPHAWRSHLNLLDLHKHNR